MSTRHTIFCALHRIIQGKVIFRIFPKLMRLLLKELNFFFFHNHTAIFWLLTAGNSRKKRLLFQAHFTHTFPLIFALLFHKNQTQPKSFTSCDSRYCPVNFFKTVFARQCRPRPLFPRTITILPATPSRNLFREFLWILHRIIEQITNSARSNPYWPGFYVSAGNEVSILPNFCCNIASKISLQRLLTG